MQFIFQHETATLKVDGAVHDSSVHVAIEMPFEIRSIDSPSHKIKIKVSLFVLLFIRIKNTVIHVIYR